MVNLIPVPGQIVTHEAPRPSLSGADISKPYTQLAFAFDKVSGGLEKVSEKLATEAGHRAVSQDKDGNLQIEPQLPIFGAAGEAYARAVKVSALAEGEGAVRRDVIKLRQQFSNDPEGFSKAIDEYRNEKVKQYGSAAGIEVGQGIGKVIDQTGTLLYRGLWNEKRRSDIKGAGAQIVTRADDYANDLVALAEQHGTDSPEYKQRLADYRSLLDEASKNPLVHFSPDQAAAHVEQTIQRSREGAFIGAVRQAYRDGDVEHAQEFVDQNLKGFTGNERERLAARAADVIRQMEAGTDKTVTDATRTPVMARDSREREGYARLIAGSLDQGWIDQHRQNISDRFRLTMQAAIAAEGAKSTAPGDFGRLARGAVENPDGALASNIDALTGGQLSREDFQALSRVALDAATETRPWVNDIRRNVAASRPDALPEISDWLASTPPDKINREIAQTRVNEIIDQHAAVEAKHLAATLPESRFLFVGRDKVKNADIVEGHSRALAAAKAGQININQLADELRLLTQWRSAVMEKG